ncbi:ATP-binding protein [Aestuariispira ectoiniformans]|uniref:ATP-binding protein n=1 Tax=Aestuariispira ectoiniformans TaxID=2775080 RepID=UPI00223C2C5B|nr:ATP-binding protein [Aestuariispira ectoiniformans]
MKTTTLSDEEYKALTDRDESHFFDVKESSIKGRGIQKIAVAFSNADGGELIVGIRDKENGQTPEDRWEGIAEIEKLNGHLQALFNVKPSLDLRYEFLKRSSTPGYALRVLIEKGSEVAATSDENIYLRQGAQSLPVKDPERISQLSFAKGAMSYEDALLTATPTEQVIETDEISTFLADHSPHTDPLEFAINQNLLDYKTWQPRTVCALLFHPNPSVVVPKKCAIKISRYQTKEEDPERDHLAEQITVEGPSYRAINEAVRKTVDIMSAVEVWTPDGLKSLNYPPEAIWETIVNAVIHRDYSISDDCHILIFDNRIEILSPGKLPGYVNVDNILEARFSRNPKLVRTLNRYKNPPNKDLGEGLNTTFQKMKEFGLKAPIIEEQGNYLKVTLPHSPLAAPTAAIIQFLQSNDQITNRQARDITGIKSENLVKIEFYKLRDEGYIERVPGLAGPKSAWRLTEAGKSYSSNNSIES